jgi:predicted alpha-1,2-mannosidase
VFDRSVGFARGRDTKGNWREPFSPFKLNVGGRGTGPKDFTEGNSWQYTWHVMQDPRGLIAAMGGKEKFLKNLNGLFSQPEKVEGMGFALDATGLVGQYAHGNEPSHHTIYLFQYAGCPDRTAELVREVCDRFYRPEPEGLCGNDDCGQMSAWYLFSAMGFYPLNPCGGEYVLGAPQVPKVVIHLGGSRSCATAANPGGSRSVATADAQERVPPRTFTIIAKNLSKENKYVKSVTLNGKPLTGKAAILAAEVPILHHADIMRGGELVFEMTGNR